VNEQKQASRQLRSELHTTAEQSSREKEKLRQKAVNQAKRKQVANKVETGGQKNLVAASHSQQSMCTA
jgi:hypothetical protein